MKRIVVTIGAVLLAGVVSAGCQTTTGKTFGESVDAFIARNARMSSRSIARFAVFCAESGANAAIAATSINTAERRRRFMGVLQTGRPPV